jgi:hypothetical protein
MIALAPSESPEASTPEIPMRSVAVCNKLLKTIAVFGTERKSSLDLLHSAVKFDSWGKGNLIKLNTLLTSAASGLPR